MTRTSDEIKKGLECCSNVNFVCNEECPYYKSLSEGEDCCLKKNADALALIRQLQVELEDMTARYKIADDCAKKKGEMNEKLYAEFTAVKSERDAAVADLKDCVTEAAQGDDFDCCFACKYNNEYGGCDRPNYTIEACGVEDFDNKWTWRGVQKEE